MNMQVLWSEAGWSEVDWRTVWDAAPEGFAQDYKGWTGDGSSMLHCLALENSVCFRENQMLGI